MRTCASRLQGILIGVFLGVALVWSPAQLRAATPLPPAPDYFVYDEPHVLRPDTLRSLQTLLAAHDRKTSEQVVFAVFSTLGDEELVTRTNEIFQHWKIGKRGKDNGVLLALYWKEHKIRIEVGYGLEPLLTDAKSKRIISESLVPSLKEGNPDQGLVLSALAILQEIQSPLIQSGEAERILKGGGFHQPRVSSQRQVNWVPIGLIIFFIIISLLNRRNRRGWGGWWGGGGGFGGGGFGGGDSGGGDSGGFSGGGGSSGGGGASGDW